MTDFHPGVPAVVESPIATILVRWFMGGCAGTIAISSTASAVNMARETIHFSNNIADGPRVPWSLFDTASAPRITRRMLRPRIFLTSSSL